LVPPKSNFTEEINLRIKNPDTQLQPDKGMLIAEKNSPFEVPIVE